MQKTDDSFAVAVTVSPMKLISVLKGSDGLYYIPDEDMAAIDELIIAYAE